MAIEATYLENDLKGVEAHEANIGTVVNVTLPGSEVVIGVRRGRSASLGMELAGYADKRGDEVLIRASEFTRVASSVPAARDILTIAGQSWQIEQVQSPDSICYIFQLLQNW